MLFSLEEHFGERREFWKSFRYINVFLWGVDNVDDSVCFCCYEFCSEVYSCTYFSLWSHLPFLMFQPPLHCYRSVFCENLQLCQCHTTLHPPSDVCGAYYIIVSHGLTSWYLAAASNNGDLFTSILIANHQLRYLTPGQVSMVLAALQLAYASTAIRDS